MKRRRFNEERDMNVASEKTGRWFDPTLQCSECVCVCVSSRGKSTSGSPQAELDSA